MNFWLLLSVLPLTFTWPSPSEQFLSGNAVAVRSITELVKRGVTLVFYPWLEKPNKGGCDESIDTINGTYDQVSEQELSS